MGTVYFLQCSASVQAEARKAVSHFLIFVCRLLKLKLFRSARTLWVDLWKIYLFFLYLLMLSVLFVILCYGHGQEMIWINNLIYWIKRILIKGSFFFFEGGHYDSPPSARWSLIFYFFSLLTFYFICDTI